MAYAHYKLYVDGNKLLADIYDESLAFAAYKARVDSTNDDENVALVPQTADGMLLTYERPKQDILLTYDHPLTRFECPQCDFIYEHVHQ